MLPRLCLSLLGSALALALMMPASLLAQGLTQKGDLRWIVLASRLDLNEAIGLARYYEGKVAFLYSSFSWRLTTPIRKLRISSIERLYRSKVGDGREST